MTASTRMRAAGVSTLMSIALVTLLAACGGADATDQKTNDAFWAPLRIAGDEVEGYTTLPEMGAAADVVARGRITDFQFGREVRTDTAEDVIVYGTMRFEPTETLLGNGNAGGRTIPIEFIINEPADEARAAIGRQAANLPDDEVVVFLRAKRGSGEQGKYRLVNSTGLWTVIDGTVTAPLVEAEEPEPGHEDEEHAPPYAAELREASTLDDLKAAITR